MLRVEPGMALLREGTTEGPSEPFHTWAPDGATAGLLFATRDLTAEDVNLVVQHATGFKRLHQPFPS